jgi:hypothetical protein
MIDNLPPEPKDLITAVKDYKVWLKDQTKPLFGSDFDLVKMRIVRLASDLIDNGKLP